MAHNSPVPRSFSKSAMTARQRKAIDLLANGVTAVEAGRQLGGVSENGVRKLWNRALAAQAREMRSADAYERGLAALMIRLEAMLLKWLPRAHQLDKDAADICLRTFALMMRISGYDAPNSTRPHAADDEPDDNQLATAGKVLPPEQIAGVLDRLETIARKINEAQSGNVIEGETVEPVHPEPKGE